MQNAPVQAIDFWGALQLVCLALFAAINLARTVSLVFCHRVNPIKIRLRKRGAMGLVELSLVLNVALWAAVVVARVLAPSVWSGRVFFGSVLWNLRLTRAIGLVLIVTAFAILVLAQIALGNAWRLGIDQENPGDLVTDGIYAFTRNPIYLFFDLYFVGTFLLHGTLFFAFSAAFTLLNLHYQIVQEERHLSALFGADYPGYCARTARYWSSSWAPFKEQVGTDVH